MPTAEDPLSEVENEDEPRTMGGAELMSEAGLGTMGEARLLKAELLVAVIVRVEGSLVLESSMSLINESSLVLDSIILVATEDESSATVITED